MAERHLVTALFGRWVEGGGTPRWDVEAYPRTIVIEEEPSLWYLREREWAENPELRSKGVETAVALVYACPVVERDAAELTDV